MPIEHVYIARVIDGLILVKSIHTSSPFESVGHLSRFLQVASMEQNTGAADRLETYKNQVCCTHLSVSSLLLSSDVRTFGSGQTTPEEIKPTIDLENEH